jgi:hypothetical protein
MELYDGILAGIFGSMSLGIASGVMTSLPLNVGVAAGALASAGLMYVGMFKHAPVPMTVRKGQA